MDFGYEKLDVAKLSKDLIKNIYKLTSSFPVSEQYGLTSQIRRATISILLNIAEGSNKESKKEFRYFVRTSIASLVEVDCALKIAIDLEYCNKPEYDFLEPCIKELYFKLVGLAKYLKS